MDIRDLIIKAENTGSDGKMYQGNIYNRKSNESSARGAFQFTRFWDKYINDFANEKGYDPKDFDTNSSFQDDFFDHYIENYATPAIERLKRRHSVPENITDDHLYLLYHKVGYPKLRELVKEGGFDNVEADISPNEYLRRAGVSTIEEEKPVAQTPQPKVQTPDTVEAEVDNTYVANMIPLDLDETEEYQDGGLLDTPNQTAETDNTRTLLTLTPTEQEMQQQWEKENLPFVNPNDKTNIATGRADQAGFFDDPITMGILTPIAPATLFSKPATSTAGKAGQFVVDAVNPIAGFKNIYKLNPFALKEAQEQMLIRARPIGQNPYVNMAEQLRAKQAAGEQLTWYQKNLLNPQTNPQMVAREKYFGQWFADNPSDLDFYINPATRNFADDAQIEILKARMPKSEAAKYSVKNFDDAKQLSNLHDTEYILPKDMVQSLERFSVEDLGKLQSEYKQMNTPHWLKGYPKSTLKSTQKEQKQDGGAMGKEEIIKDVNRYIDRFIRNTGTEIPKAKLINNEVYIPNLIFQRKGGSPLKELKRFKKSGLLGVGSGSYYLTVDHLIDSIVKGNQSDLEIIIDYLTKEEEKPVVETPQPKVQIPDSVEAEVDNTYVANMIPLDLE